MIELLFHTNRNACTCLSYHSITSGNSRQVRTALRLSSILEGTGCISFVKGGGKRLLPSCLKVGANTHSWTALGVSALFFLVNSYMQLSGSSLLYYYGRGFIQTWVKLGCCQWTVLEIIRGKKRIFISCTWMLLCRTSMKISGFL